MGLAYTIYFLLFNSLLFDNNNAMHYTVSNSAIKKVEVIMTLALRNEALLAPQVTASEIEEYIAIQSSVAALKERLEILEIVAKKAEVRIIESIESGVTIAAGRYTVSVREVSKRFPAWKEHFIAKLGKHEADAVLEATPAKLYRTLVIK